MLNKIRGYFDKNKNLVNIFLVYFFLTFVIGYLDFDRRVYTFEESTQKLQTMIEGKSALTLNRRILIPYIINFVHKVSHISLKYTYALFRFFFFFLAFCLFHVYLKKWFDDKLAMIGTLSMVASLPLFLTNWYCLPSDIPNLIFFILGAMWIKENRYKLLYLLIPIATLNKETMVAIVLLYFLYGLGREKPYILIKRTTIYGLLWLIPYVVTTIIFGYEPFANFCTLKHNTAGLLHIFKTLNPYNNFYFLLYLCGFYWILALRNFRKKDPFLKKSVIVMALYFLYVFLRVGAINEVRVFIPFYVFVIPLGLFSLFGEDRSHSRV